MRIDLIIKSNWCWSIQFRSEDHRRPAVSLQPPVLPFSSSPQLSKSGVVTCWSKILKSFTGCIFSPVSYFVLIFYNAFKTSKREKKTSFPVISKGLDSGHHSYRRLSGDWQCRPFLLRISLAKSTIDVYLKKRYFINRCLGCKLPKNDANWLVNAMANEKRVISCRF